MAMGWRERAGGCFGAGAGGARGGRDAERRARRERWAMASRGGRANHSRARSGLAAVRRRVVIVREMAAAACRPGHSSSRIPCKTAAIWASQKLAGLARRPPHCPPQVPATPDLPSASREITCPSPRCPPANAAVPPAHHPASPRPSRPPPTRPGRTSLPLESPSNSSSALPPIMNPLSVR